MFPSRGTILLYGLASLWQWCAIRATQFEIDAKEATSEKKFHRLQRAANIQTNTDHKGISFSKV